MASKNNLLPVVFRSQVGK
jgi:Holliday junction resolvase RusA-like endonuclease